MNKELDGSAREWLEDMEDLEFDSQMARMVDLMREGGIVRHDDAVRVFRRHFVRRSMMRHKGNASYTAAELGVHRNTIGRYLLELGLSRPWLGRPREEAGKK